MNPFEREKALDRMQELDVVKPDDIFQYIVLTSEDCQGAQVWCYDDGAVMVFTVADRNIIFLWKETSEEERQWYRTVLKMSGFPTENVCLGDLRHKEVEWWNAEDYLVLLDPPIDFGKAEVLEWIFF